MKYDRTNPCASCPYRKDARLGFWAAEHFTKLLANDADPIHGSVYACHEGGKLPPEERGPCVGWLLDQRRRLEPSIQLRLKLMNDEGFRAQYAKISTGGVKLWRTLQAMCRANLKAIAKGGRR